MADEDDRCRIAPIIRNGLLDGAAPRQIGLYARRDSSVAYAIGQAIHAARIDEAGYAAKQISAAARFDGFLGRRTSRLPGDIARARKRNGFGGWKRRPVIRLPVQSWLSGAGKQRVERCRVPSISGAGCRTGVLRRRGSS